MGVQVTSPISVPDSVSTKVYGQGNKTAISVQGEGKKVTTEVAGSNNETIVNVYNSFGGSKVAKAAAPASKQKTEQPKKQTAPDDKKKITPGEPKEPRMSIRETEQRAKQLIEASYNGNTWGLGTDEESFYNAVTTVPGGEDAKSRRVGDPATMDKRVFLSKDNLIALDKYLKTNGSSSMGGSKGLRYYINEEFTISDRSDFHNNKMRELVNLLDQYGIK